MLALLLLLASPGAELARVDQVPPPAAQRAPPQPKKEPPPLSREDEELVREMALLEKLELVKNLELFEPEAPQPH